MEIKTSYKKRKCTDCQNFIASDPDPKKSSCKVKTGYITQNALINAYCEDFNFKDILYTVLRNLVKFPYTLSNDEIKLYKAFINAHESKLGDFTWFFDLSSANTEIASSETQSLLTFIDELEKKGISGV